MNTFSVQGNLVDVRRRTIYPARINVVDGIIDSIEELFESQNTYIMPGFIDAHVHIESSMLVPSQFARIAVRHGTIATVSDPHEIANVVGLDGVKFMIDNGNSVPFKFYFGAPSCVPATAFETAGAGITNHDIELLFDNYGVRYLSEMMNFPGVLMGDISTVGKIELAKLRKLPIDGHAPGLIGDIARKYIEAGVSTDHECTNLEEAISKIGYGMKILIREGSAAKDFDALHSLISSHTSHAMLCSDDKHPDDLIEGHINKLVARALAYGHNLFDTLQVAIINPINHYNLDIGTIQIGDKADFIIVNDLEEFKLKSTYIDGIKVAESGKELFGVSDYSPINNFNAQACHPSDFLLRAKSEKIKVIDAIDGELYTKSSIHNALLDQNGYAVSDINRDILKLAVINRYSLDSSKPALGFIRKVGLKSGALAQSVSHDSHNIVAVGTNDNDIAKAVNMVIANQGGIAISDGSDSYVLPLQVAGIMSNQTAEEVAIKYKEINSIAKMLGSNLNAPFMTLSFMALLVIPELKLSDKGLFDANKFEFCELFV